MSRQINEGNKVECLSCKKTWTHHKSGSTNLMSYDQGSYSPSEFKEHPNKLWVIESSQEPPYPSIAGRLRKEPNTLEIPTRPKGGRGHNPWADGIPKNVKVEIKKKMKDFDYSQYTSFAIPDCIGEGELDESDIKWLYSTIESELPFGD